MTTIETAATTIEVRPKRGRPRLDTPPLSEEEKKQRNKANQKACYERNKAKYNATGRAYYRAHQETLRPASLSYYYRKKAERLTATVQPVQPQL